MNNIPPNKINCSGSLKHFTKANHSLMEATLQQLNSGRNNSDTSCNVKDAVNRHEGQSVWQHLPKQQTWHSRPISKYGGLSTNRSSYASKFFKSSWPELQGKCSKLEQISPNENSNTFTFASMVKDKDVKSEVYSKESCVSSHRLNTISQIKHNTSVTIDDHSTNLVSKHGCDTAHCLNGTDQNFANMCELLSSEGGSNHNTLLNESSNLETNMDKEKVKLDRAMKRHKKKAILKEEKRKIREAEAIKKLIAPKDQRVRLVDHTTLEKFTAHKHVSTTTAMTTPIDNHNFPALGNTKRPVTELSVKHRRSHFSKENVDQEKRTQEMLDTSDGKQVNRVINEVVPGKILTSVKEKSVEDDTKETAGMKSEVNKKENKMEPVVSSKRPKRKDPIKIDILQVIKETKHHKVAEPHVGVLGSKVRKREEPRFYGNQLDASNPQRKRGKVREVPRRKQLSKLKLAILAERARRKRIRDVCSSILLMRTDCHSQAIRDPKERTEMGSPNNIPVLKHNNDHRTATDILRQSNVCPKIQKHNDVFEGPESLKSNVYDLVNLNHETLFSGSAVSSLNMLQMLPFITNPTSERDQVVSAMKETDMILSAMKTLSISKGTETGNLISNSDTVSDASTVAAEDRTESISHCNERLDQKHYMSEETVNSDVNIQSNNSVTNNLVLNVEHDICDKTTPCGEDVVMASSKQNREGPAMSVNIAKFHSRKFRDYCNHSITPELNNAVTALVQDVIKFHDRQFQRDPLKASSKRRHVTGLKEVKKFLGLKRLKMLIIAPDLERAEGEGGLDQMIGQLKETAAAQQVPCVFALSRRRLGVLTFKKVLVSCLGILNYEGTENNFRSVLEALEAARIHYRALVGLLLVDHTLNSPVPQETVLETVSETKKDDVDVNKQVITSLLAKLIEKKPSPPASPFLRAIEKQSCQEKEESDSESEGEFWKKVKGFHKK